jgi:hypothetical protein
MKAGDLFHQRRGGILETRSATDTAALRALAPGRTNVPSIARKRKILAEIVII